MSGKRKKPAPAGGTGSGAAEKRMDRAMDLLWAETVLGGEKKPAAPASPNVDVELVAELAPLVETEPIELVPIEEPGPFIEATLVEPAPVKDPSAPSVADWLADVEAPPSPAPPLAPSNTAAPDWLSDLAEACSQPVRPAPPLPEPETPDWLADVQRLAEAKHPSFPPVSENGPQEGL